VEIYYTYGEDDLGLPTDFAQLAIEVDEPVGMVVIATILREKTGLDGEYDVQFNNGVSIEAEGGSSTVTLQVYKGWLGGEVVGEMTLTSTGGSGGTCKLSPNSKEFDKIRAQLIKSRDDDSGEKYELYWKDGAIRLQMYSTHASHQSVKITGKVTIPLVLAKLALERDERLRLDKMLCVFWREDYETKNVKAIALYGRKGHALKLSGCTVDYSAPIDRWRVDQMMPETLPETFNLSALVIWMSGVNAYDVADMLAGVANFSEVFGGHYGLMAGGGREEYQTKDSAKWEAETIDYASMGFTDSMASRAEAAPSVDKESLELAYDIMYKRLGVEDREIPYTYNGTSYDFVPDRLAKPWEFGEYIITH